jgi:hypothetical protein
LLHQRQATIEQEGNIMRAFDHTSMEYSPEMGAFEAEQFEWGGEAEWGGETEVFNEMELMGLAHELLSVTNEAELDRFLGDVIQRAGQALGGVVRSPIRQAVGGFLKGAAKRALPLAGGAVGGPLGAKIGSGLASAAGSTLGLEAEAFSGEDREVEGAKNFARLAGDTVKGAVTAEPSAPAATVVRAAVTTAAQKHAPGLLRGAPRPGNGAGRTGRWIRQGRNIIVCDV